MGRIYKIPLEPTVIGATTPTDILELLAATAKKVQVHGWHLAQTSDVGDTEEEILHLSVMRGNASDSGSGGSTQVPRKQDEDDADPGLVAEVFNTTLHLPGTGSLFTIENFGWNVRLPWDFFYPPELRELVRPADFFIFRIVDGPVDDIEVVGTFWVEEI